MCKIGKSFAEMGIDIGALKADQGMEDVDDFDFICYKLRRKTHTLACGMKAASL